MCVYVFIYTYMFICRCIYITYVYKNTGRIVKVIITILIKKYLKQIEEIINSFILFQKKNIYCINKSEIVQSYRNAE